MMYVLKLIVKAVMLPAVVAFLIPVVGEAVVTAVAALNAGMRNFIRS